MVAGLFFFLQRQCEISFNLRDYYGSRLTCLPATTGSDSRARFLRAGARDVLASLWPVEDEATATLMTSFYGNFRSGANGANALAEAQRAAIRDPSRSAPLRWAGFVMTGAR